MLPDLIPAFMVAEYAHRVLPKKPENAYRKFGTDKVPYIVHPVRVMLRVMDLPYATVRMGQVALLHDVSEDTTLENKAIVDQFGQSVMDGITHLTSYSKQICSTDNRTARKKMDLDHMATIPQEEQVIKLCDILDNWLDLGPNASHDFIRLYMRETYERLNVIGNAEKSITEKIVQRLVEINRVANK